MPDRIEVLENIFNSNDQIASNNRAVFDQNHIFSMNLMASPGAGKTSLIERVLNRFSRQYSTAVIDGDIATSLDADRAAAAGAVAVQINTGGTCHLDAMMIKNALTGINLDEIDLLLVENVGNLICPANFKLGTHKNILVASVPEGEDKPYKYPIIYQDVDVLILNKIDLLPYIPFDSSYFLRGVRILNSNVEIFQVSCLRGDGLDQWFDWIEKQIQAHKTQLNPVEYHE